MYKFISKNILSIFSMKFLEFLDIDQHIYSIGLKKK